jgi:RNA ligase (TIGR02306 family)
MYHNLEGTDVTELLGIQKWEAPVNAQLAGVCRSTFPSWIPKTDQERCQNLKKEIQIAFEQGDEFEVTEKMDGSSMTIAATKFEDPEYNQTIVDVRVCSRNLDLKLDQEGNTFVNTAKNSGLIDAITRYVSLGFPEIAVQGELVGPGIQGNIYNLTEHRFYVFDIYDIRKGEYFKPFEREFIWHKLNQLGGRFYHVPVVYGNLKLPSSNIDDLLVLAEGPGYNYCTEREGLVFKSNNGGFSFKAISNKFLLGEK